MNPDQALQELYDLQRFSIKMGLDNIQALCNFLGNPQEQFPSIHIAGTNGKGSTAVLIQRILSLHGLQTGLYTSPHLVDFNERIRIDEALIDNHYMASFWHSTRDLILTRKATFFDATTALAFKYFAENRVDLAVIETGLGGRLDSTNILRPRAVVLTPIDRDHEKQLGKDYAGIAREKAAIIKDGAMVFSAGQRPEAEEVLNLFRHRPDGFVFAPEQTRVSNVVLDGDGINFTLTDLMRNTTYGNIRLSMVGEHQAANAALAYLSARWYLEQIDFRFSEKKFRKALANICWPGRLHKIASNPDIIFDVSHNESGFETSLKYAAKHYKDHRRLLLLGLLSDKDFHQIAAMVSKVFERIMVTEPVSPRKMDAGALQEVFRKQGIEAEAIPELEKAYRKASKNLAENEVLFVMGSHFLIGELFKTIRKRT